MIFVGRYELGDLLLTTSVETFSARDLSDQVRVLVHVFPAAEHRLGAADPPQAVIDRFGELTGASPALARNAAVDPATGYAYVVTGELPQETISCWGRRSAPGAPPGAAAPGVSGIFSMQPEAGPASSAPDAAPESVTKEFTPGMLVAEAQRLPESAGGSGKQEIAGVSSGAPGAFTKMFGTTGGQATNQEPHPAISAPGASGAGPGAFTKMFGTPGAQSSKDESQPAISPPGASGAGAGAFTRMFGNAATPAAQQVEGAGFETSPDASALPDSSAPLSNVFPGEHQPQPAPGLNSPAPADQVRSTQPGSFTRMFGSPGAAPPVSSDNAGSPPPMFGSEAAAEPKPPASSDGRFTSLFGQHAPERTPDKVEATRPPLPTAPGAANVAAPVLPLSSAEPPTRTTPGGSTQFFRAGISPPPAAGVGIPPGPSEYTRVISLRSISPAAPQPAPTPGPAMPPAMPPPVPPAPAQFPVVPFGGQAPPTPYFPATVPTPPMSPVAAMPQVGFPGAPGMPVPQPPQPPNLGWPQAGGPQVPRGPLPEASSRRSWLPLILIFNALFVLAVIVILLFALKGR